MTLFAAAAVKLQIARFASPQDGVCICLRCAGDVRAMVAANNGLMLFSDGSCWRTGGFLEGVLTADIIVPLLFPIGQCAMEMLLRTLCGCTEDCTYTVLVSPTTNDPNYQRGRLYKQTFMISPSWLAFLLLVGSGVPQDSEPCTV